MSNGGGDDTIIINWRHMQTALCLGGPLGGCPVKRDGHYDIVRIGYVESLHRRIAQLELNLEQAAVDARVDFSGPGERLQLLCRIRDQQKRIGDLEGDLVLAARGVFDHELFQRESLRELVEPEIAEPVHDYGSPEMSRREAWQRFETKTGIDPVDHDAVKDYFTKNLVHGWWRI